MISLLQQAKGATSGAVAAMEQARRLGVQGDAAGPVLMAEVLVACTVCAKPAARLKCPCQKASYCGAGCHKTHWALHSKDCRLTLARELNAKALACAREAYALYMKLGPAHSADAQKALHMIGMLEGILNFGS